MDIVREPNGFFKKGHTANHSGRPPSVFAYQADVADRLLQKYTPSEIIAIAGDPVRLDRECSSFQAMIIIQLANALSARDNNDNALERERLLDRVIGKPLQKIEQKINVSIETEAALLEGRRRVAKNRAPVEVTYSVVDEPMGIDVERNKGESELSSPDKEAARAEARRASAREYRSKYYDKIKDRPSFNDQLAAKMMDDKKE